MTLVVLFHLWPRTVTGGYVGVDVFLVISGYLITSHLLRKPPGTGYDLWAFWARRLRRLLPASLVVLGATAVATRLVAPSTAWDGIAKEIFASALYMQNWALAISSTDYMNEEAVASPVQHFWSLSVEEQFYLVWPVLILGVTWFAWRLSRRSGGHARTGADDLRRTSLTRTMIGSVVVVSFAFSVWFTAVQPAAAYFVTPTRIWELAFGGLIATFVTVGSRRPDGTIGTVVAWVGIVAIAAAALLFTSSTPFPGAAALLPVLGASAVIIADTDRPLSPTGLLKHPWIQWLGDVSYSVYLWHWPLIALLPYVSGGRLGVLDKCVIVVATLVVAGLSKVHIEDRFRFARPQAPLRPIYQFSAVGMMAVTLIAALQLTEVGVRKEMAKEELAAVVGEQRPCFGAAALANGAKDCEKGARKEIVPKPILASGDKADINQSQCFPRREYDERLSCNFGSGDVRIALVGNSHAQHWLPALRKLGKERGWSIDTYIISKCTATDAKQSFNTARKTSDCYDWGQWVLNNTKGDAYDLVISSEYQSAPIVGHSLADSFRPAIEGYESYLTKWADAGTNVLVIEDPAVPGFHIPQCVATYPDDLQHCSGSPEDWKIHRDALFEAAKNIGRDNIDHVSFDDLVCGIERCQGVIGGVIAYYDSSHLSATYVKTMAPYMAPSIEKSLQGAR